MVAAEILKHEEDGYTIILKGEGGPVISDHDLSECKRKFIEALHLCRAIRNLLHYEMHKCFYDMSPIEEIIYGDIKYVGDFN